MSKKYLPFESFDWSCLDKAKTLHDTMQESPNDKFKDDSHCKPNCVPYWQETGETRCGPNNIMEAEEADGCGNTKWIRKELVSWVKTGETGCNDKENRILLEEVNQCGDSRWVTTSDRCCDPEWVRVPDTDPNCDQVVLRVLEEDGCGNTRWANTSNPVSWTQTGESRCLPGDVYEVEQINQCGHTRWQQLQGGCPCIPNWQPAGPQRCTGLYVENQEHDGCGNTRWASTSTLVNWANTGESRCRNGLVQNQQINQCGTTRWFDTETTCTNSPPANELSSKYVSELLSGPGKKFMSCRLDAPSGLIYWGQGVDGSFTDGGEQSESWVSGAYDRGDYEVKISYTSGEPEGEYRTREGSALDVWHDLGNISQVTHTMTSIESSWPLPNQGIITTWTNIIVRIDIRKKGESISGGCTFGPFTLRAT